MPVTSRVYCVPVSCNYVGVKCILDPGRSIWLSPEALHVCIVFREQQLRFAIAVQPSITQIRVRCLDHARQCLPKRGFAVIITP